MTGNFKRKHKSSKAGLLPQEDISAPSTATYADFETAVNICGMDEDSFRVGSLQLAKLCLVMLYVMQHVHVMEFPISDAVINNDLLAAAIGIVVCMSSIFVYSQSFILRSHLFYCFNII